MNGPSIHLGRERAHLGGIAPRGVRPEGEAVVPFQTRNGAAIAGAGEGLPVSGTFDQRDDLAIDRLRAGELQRRGIGAPAVDQPAVLQVG